LRSVCISCAVADPFKTVQLRCGWFFSWLFALLGHVRQSMRIDGCVIQIAESSIPEITPLAPRLTAFYCAVPYQCIAFYLEVLVLLPTPLRRAEITCAARFSDGFSYTHAVQATLTF
jgi:hypothetical protein